MKNTPQTQEQILCAFGHRIAALRKSAGLTQDQLASITMIDIQAIQRAETGRNALSFVRLFQIAAAVGTTPTNLFEFDGGIEVIEFSEKEELQVIAAWRSVDPL
jgi:transcriptional regulator with XRE-family HTH domain